MGELNGNYKYYPGCSLEATASAYDVSTQRVAETLGIVFEEVNDWNCCGATEYFSVKAVPAYSLVARNLAIAAQDGQGDLVAPCSACFINLYKTDSYMSKHLKLNQQVNQALGAGGLSYEPGTMNVRHLLNVIVEDIGHEAITERVVRPLNGIRVAPYYGCLIVRPDSHYNTEYPTHMDKLLTALGATVVDFPLKTHCCGGHMTQISEDVGYELIRRIAHNATEYEADAIITICPMCQLNLDAYQGQVNRHFGTSFEMPVLFFTQLMGLAFGMPPYELGFGTEMVSANPMLAKIGKDEEPKKRKPKRRDKSALPMPQSRT